MDNNKLGKEIYDWATSFGFRLSDGSTPPPDYFALFTATPRRRELWETIVESIQPRHKIERMRKQILVAKLLNRKKVSKADGSKQFTDRLELWERKIKLEDEIKDKKIKLVQLEKNILGRTSDLLFEVCKLAGSEKQVEEIDEKSVAVSLHTKKETKMFADFKTSALVLQTVCAENKLEKELQNFSVNDLFNSKKCDNPDDHTCELLHLIKEILHNGHKVEFVWDEMMQNKRKVFDKFSSLLNNLHLTVSCENKKEIEEKSNWLMNQIKQRATEKSLQTILNVTEKNLSSLDINKLLRRLFSDTEMEDESLNKTISFISFNESESIHEYDEAKENVRDYIKMIGREGYQNFLKEEITRLKEEDSNEKLRRNNKLMGKRSCEEIDHCFKDFELVLNEINNIKSEEENTEESIILAQEKIESLIFAILEEAEAKFKTNEFEKTVKNFKSNCEKRIQTFLETPVNAFKTVENISGRLEFECESAAHCLKNYGGEFKQILSAILISPTDNVDQIISILNERKIILKQMKDFVSANNLLTESLNEINEKIGNIVWNSEGAETSYNESNAILDQILTDSNELMMETAYLEKILINWVEQPYRSMIKDTIDGKSLKDFEEDCKKRKNDWFL